MVLSPSDLCAKVVSCTEDAHVRDMSTFEIDEHLRGCRAVLGTSLNTTPQLVRHLDKRRPLRRARGAPAIALSVTRQQSSAKFVAFASPMALMETRHDQLRKLSGSQSEPAERIPQPWPSYLKETLTLVR